VPLVVRVWERVSEMGVVERVVVATDTEDIARAVRDAGGECVLTGAGHLSGTDRVAEVSARPEFQRYDLVCNVQGDEPFLSADAVHGALAQVADAGYPIGTTAVPATEAVLDDPAIVKVVCADDGRALYFSRAAIPHLRDGADRGVRAGLVRQHLGVYAYTRAALARWVALPPHPLEISERLEQLRPLAAGVAIGVATGAEVPPMGGIDTEADLMRANSIWAELTAGRA
jgi:3-deoxy-manno-octulosonate cytidylyltransferase (CMP-KDO synthetase)